MTKKFKLYICCISILMCLLFSGCTYVGNNKILHNSECYRLTYQDNSISYGSPWSIDNDWSKLSTLGPKRIFLSPDSEIVLVGIQHPQMYVKKGCVAPYYDNLVYDNIKVASIKKVDSFDIVQTDYYSFVQENLPNATWENIVNKETTCLRSSDVAAYKMYIQIHSSKSLWWNFHVFVDGNNYYIVSLDEDIGYLLVDEFADWLRTLEPTLN